MAQSPMNNRPRGSNDDDQTTMETAATAARDAAETVSGKLKSVGVDTDQIVDAAKDQVSELQRLLMDEMRARPMRALGVAAAVGLFVGLMTAR